MKIWVTGIAGFLGSHLADELIADGHKVYGNDSLICGDVDNIPKGIYGASVFESCQEWKGFGGVLKDVGIDVIVHCAATAHEGLSSFSPSFITKNIYEASVATFSAAIAAGVKRIVFMSSMSRYGNGYNYPEIEEAYGVHSLVEEWCGPPFSEDYETNPVDPYAVAKVAAEDTLKILAKTHGVNYAILVPHNIIGTRQRYIDPFRNVASIMINRCLLGMPPIIYGDGQQTRCFSPVDDCIPSIIKAVHGAADGEVVNIGPDKGEITISELAGKIIALTGAEPYALHRDDRPNEVKHAYCSSDKARRLLGYEEKQTIDECLKEMVEDIKRLGPKPFDYSFSIEITEGCPEVWLKREM